MPESVKISQALGNGSIIKDPQDLKAESNVKSQVVFKREARYGAHNYEPIPVALTRGQGKCSCFDFIHLLCTIFCNRNTVHDIKFWVCLFYINKARAKN